MKLFCMNRTGPKQAALHRRRGAITVLSAIMLVVLVGFVAFTVDIGVLQMARTQLQVAADASALAGALELGQRGSKDPNLLQHVDEASADIAGRHVAVGKTVQSQTSDFALGIWDPKSLTFTRLSGDNLASANAVEVKCFRNSAHGSSVPLFFAPALGVKNADAGATAIAWVKSSRCGLIVGINSVAISGDTRTKSTRCQGRDGDRDGDDRDGDGRDHDGRDRDGRDRDGRDHDGRDRDGRDRDGRDCDGRDRDGRDRDGRDRDHDGRDRDRDGRDRDGRDREARDREGRDRDGRDRDGRDRDGRDRDGRDGDGRDRDGRDGDGRDRDGRDRDERDRDDRERDDRDRDDDRDGQNPDSNQGHVCSNGDVTLSGSSRISGDAHPGPDRDVKGGGGRVTGNTKPLSKPMTFPEVDPGNAERDNENHRIPKTKHGKNPLDDDGKLKVSDSDSVTLSPGTYYFREMEVSRGATVRVTGPTTIYVKEKCSLRGGRLKNHTELPKNLRLHVIGKEDVDISGDSDFHGTVYAPKAKVVRDSSSHFYGSLVGESLELSGRGRIHADQSLDSDSLLYRSVTSVLVK